LTPGAGYDVTISGPPGDRLSLTTMMGQSNDWFYAPAESGIALFKDGKPLSGDITSEIILWDAGTEVNQEPGIGPDQGPRQKAPNTGKAENGLVRNAKDLEWGSAYSNTSSMMRGWVCGLDGEGGRRRAVARSLVGWPVGRALIRAVCFRRHVGGVPPRSPPPRHVLRSRPVWGPLACLVTFLRGDGRWSLGAV